MRMKWLSLFSGIGGFDLALEREGHRVVAASEIQEDSWKVYKRHFPGVENLGNIESVEADGLRGHIDAICAGFPCQPFSLAGKRLGTADSRGLMAFEVLRIARQSRPRYLLLENVPGLLSSAGGRDFGALLRAMDECGYDAEWQCINGSNFLPQNRPRLFIVGYLRGKCSGGILPVPGHDRHNRKARGAARGKGPRLQDEVSGTIDANYRKGLGRTAVVVNSSFSPYRVRSAKSGCRHPKDAFRGKYRNRPVCSTNCPDRLKWNANQEDIPLTVMLPHCRRPAGDEY